MLVIHESPVGTVHICRALSPCAGHRPYVLVTVSMCWLLSYGLLPVPVCRALSPCAGHCPYVLVMPPMPSPVPGLLPPHPPLCRDTEGASCQSVSLSLRFWLALPRAALWGELGGWCGAPSRALSSFRPTVCQELPQPGLRMLGVLLPRAPSLQTLPTGLGW